jgi:hypothetical protein
VKKLIAMFALCAFLFAGVVSTVGCGGGGTTKKTEKKEEKKEGS